ncbi:hypothetical protein PGQ11_010284 [Apiospora arundinis]|uniref:Myb-like domain-containing protein n=1 Tax=Apiospora arundinis TaxID=335852 RepID=A0ABR2IA53_9PEZI
MLFPLLPSPAIISTMTQPKFRQMDSIDSMRKKLERQQLKKHQPQSQMVATPPFVQVDGTTVLTPSDSNFQGYSLMSWDGINVNGSCTVLGDFLGSIALQSQDHEPIPHGLETPVSEFVIGNSTESMCQQSYSQPEIKNAASGPLHTSRAHLEPPSTRVSPRAVTLLESQQLLSNLTTASTVQLSPISDDTPSCTNTEYKADVEGDMSIENRITDTPVPGKGHTIGDIGSCIVVSTESMASTVPTANAEEPAAAIPSADTSQAGNLDRSSSVSGTPVAASYTTAGREKRCCEGVNGANGTNGPRPAKRTKHEDTTTRALRSLPPRGPSVQRNNFSPGSPPKQPTRASKFHRVTPSSPKPVTSQSYRQSYAGNRPGPNSIQLLNPSQHLSNSRTRSSTPLERTAAPNSFSGQNVQDTDNLGAGSNHQPLLRTPSHSAEKSSPMCHVCGFAPERLLQLMNSVEMLLSSRTSLSDGETSRVMLQLLIGSVRDCIDLSHQNRAIVQSSGSLKLEHDYTVDATIQPRSAMEVSSDDESTNGTDDSDSQSDGAESDATSCSIDEHKQSKRRRWSALEECRLRAWIREGKDCKWIADKLHRSEAAVSQHWTIMAQKPGSGKKRI